MKKYRFKNGIHEGDYWILFLTLGISLFGIVMEFSAGYYVSLSKFGDPYAYLRSAVIWFLLGWAAFIICSFINYNIYKYFAIPALVVGFVLLLLLFTPLGVTLNNATRWIELMNGRITIMPGEIVKTSMILFFAWFYARNKDFAVKFKWIAFAILIAAVSFSLSTSSPIYPLL